MQQKNGPDPVCLTVCLTQILMLLIDHCTIQCMTSPLVCPLLLGACVQWRQRWAAERQLAAEAIKKAEEAETEKVETEEVETIGKKATGVKPLDVKAIKDKLAE